MDNKTILSFSTHLLSGMLGALAILALVINNTPDINHTLDKNTKEMLDNEAVTVDTYCNELIKLQEKLNTAFRVSSLSEEIPQLMLSQQQCEQLLSKNYKALDTLNYSKVDTLKLSN